MRKMLLSLSAATVIVVGGLPSTANPWVDASQLALASWIEMDGRTGRFYVALGIHDVYAEGIETVGAIFKGKCRKRVTNGKESIQCAAGGKLRKLSAEDFEFDPALSDAHLRVPSHGFVHRVSWTGKGPAPQVTGGVSHGGNGWAADAGLFRPASARGRLFDDRVTPQSWLSLAVLAEWGGAFAVLPVDGHELQLDQDGSVWVTRTVQLN